MSYAVKRVQRFASSPDHPQTATVYDFACLFTHDLKRKAKRWQDGKLKYHTFNKKVMVYDDRGHFVGDAHWDGDEDVVEGDELELDRGGVMVQVADCKGEREQDLTEVLDKRVREVEKRRQQAAANAPRHNTNSAVVAAARRQQHLPLSGLLQSPGPIGRAAIPNWSPFEARRQVLSHIGEPRETPQKSSAPPAKKRRLSPSPPSKAGFANSLFGTKLSLSATPSSELLAARARALRERTNLQESRELEAQQEATRPAIKKSVLKGLQPSTLRALGMSAEKPVDIDEEESEPDDGPERTSHYFEELPKSKQRIQEPHRNEIRNAKQPKARDAIGETNQEIRAARSSPARYSSPSTRLERRSSTKTAAPRKRAPSFDLPDTTPSPPRQKVPKKQSVQAASGTPSPPPRAEISKERSEVLESDSGKQARKEAKERRRAAKAAVKEQSKDKRTEGVCEGERPSRAEPRTALRIRARKRRGLLMMSETLPHPQPRQPSPDIHSAVTMDSPEPDSKDMSPEPQPRQLKYASPELASKLPAQAETTDIPQSPKSPEPPSTVQRLVRTPQFPEVEAPSSPINQIIPSSPQKEVKSTDLTCVDPENSQDIYNASIPSTAPQPAADISVSESAVEKNSPIVLLDSSPIKAKVRSPVRLILNESTTTELPAAALVQPPAVETVAASDEDPSPPRQRNLRRKASKTFKSYIVQSEDEDETVDGDNPKPETEESDHIEAPESPPPVAPQGPRLARMARKSVKSREIFGFVPEATPGIMPMQFAKATVQLGNWKDVNIETDPPTAAVPPAGATPKQNQTNRNEVEIRMEAKEKQESVVPSELAKNENEQVVTTGRMGEPVITTTEQQDASTVIPTATVVPKDDISPEPTSVNETSRPRIINPATRGKKAARKEDAAGKAPQAFVPFEPPRIISRIAVKPQPELRRVEKPTVALPSFIAASGGAWSIHAHDLLGMARPSK